MYFIDSLRHTVSPLFNTSSRQWSIFLSSAFQIPRRRGKAAILSRRNLKSLKTVEFQEVDISTALA